MPRWLRVTLPLALVLALATGCVSWARLVTGPSAHSRMSGASSIASPVGPTLVPEATPTPSPVPTEATGSTYLAVLNSLAVDDAPESHAGYDRGLFHVWIDANGDGCNTRAEVLKLQSLAMTTHHNRCTIDTGEWVSLYDGATLTDASLLDIDHVVPLSEAWKSGAWQWSPDTRTRFANDLGFAGALLAVSSSSNRSKGDSDPASWMPIASAGCDYSQRWVAVKYRWSLTVDTAEKAALSATLRVCAVELWSLPERAPVATTG